MSADYPHVTVAVVVERDDTYLLVKENAEQGEVFNQPAGHLELNESLFDAARRETLEETGWHIRLDGFLGLSQYRSPTNGVTYIRVSFVGSAIAQAENPTLDPDILSVHWLSWAEIQALDNLRSPMVLRDIERLRAQQDLPLTAVAVLNIGELG